MKTVKRHHGLGLLGAIAAMLGEQSSSKNTRPFFDFYKEKSITKSRRARIMHRFKKRPAMGEREKTRLQKRQTRDADAGYKNPAWKLNPTLSLRFPF